MKIFDKSFEDLFEVLPILIVIGAIVLLFGVLFNLPSNQKLCLESVNPRRYIPNKNTCQEYRDGQWVEVDYRIEYNEAGQDVEGEADEN